MADVSVSLEKLERDRLELLAQIEYYKGDIEHLQNEILRAELQIDDLDERIHWLSSKEKF